MVGKSSVFAESLRDFHSKNVGMCGWEEGEWVFEEGNKMTH